MKTIRDIPGFEGYAVDTDGNVYSRRPLGLSRQLRSNWSPLRSGKDKDGYLMVILQVDGTKRVAKVHHLVLEAFVGEKPKGHECSHKNGIRSDNRLSNLEWSTKRENIAKKKEHGTYQFGENNPYAKLTLDKVNEIKRIYAGGGVTMVELGTLFGVCAYTIRRIVHGESWTGTEAESKMTRQNRGCKET
jgi:hypothetical protein